MKEVNIKQLNHREREEAVNEIRLLASVEHPNIITYCEAFLERDSLYIVTDFASKGDLHKLIKKQKARKTQFPEEQVWTLLGQICAGVGALHAGKVLHRDLKPKNIFVQRDGGLQIGDLGCSKLNKKNFAKTQVGTPYYMSPEIWMKRPYNDKSDVWAIGCLLFEMIAFHPPFLADDMNALSHKIRNCPPARFSGRWSANLTGLLTRLLSKDPARRPTVAEILAMPQVQAQLPDKSKEQVAKPMLKTIHVPRHMGRGARMNGLQLPAKQYPAADKENAGVGNAGPAAHNPPATARCEPTARPTAPPTARPAQARPTGRPTARPTARPQAPLPRVPRAHGAPRAQQQQGYQQHGQYRHQGYGQQRKANPGYAHPGYAPRYNDAANIYDRNGRAQAGGAGAGAGAGYGQQRARNAHAPRRRY